jgi:hypothetical protein
VTAWHKVLAVLVVATGMSAAAFAQEGNRFALGGSYTKRGVPSSAAHGGQGPGLEWRFGHATEGWGWHYGLNWYATDVDHNIAGQKTSLGELRMRPFMAGYGYTHVMGPFALTVGGLAGYAFTAMDLSRDASDAYLNRLGVRSVDLRTSGAPVVKPEIGVWYDLSRKIGLTANIGYVVARPKITVTTPIGHDVERLRADAWSFTIGSVYRIF